MRADTAPRADAREPAAGDRETAAVMLEAFYYSRTSRRLSTSKAVDCLRLWPRHPKTPGAWSSSRAPSTCSFCGPSSGAPARPRHRPGHPGPVRRPAQGRNRSLYPALHRLVKRGWLKAEWGVSEANQRAKYCKLTATGKAQLSREQDRWSQLVHAIGRIMNPAPASKE